VLWQIRTPSGIIGQPVSYQSNDGRQYVAILSGVGGWPGVVANAEVDPRLRNGALGFTGAMQDLPAYTAGGSTLLVFALPQQGPPHQGAPLPTGLGAPTRPTNQEQGNAPRQ
jgi:alcohol dehydrogenase (cytochrome c)